MSRITPDSYMASLELFEVYRVGGSVRDEILGRKAKDSDYIVRTATLDEIAVALHAGRAKAVAPLKLRTGQQIGWHATTPVGHLEIVMPRTEVSTGPGRHDFAILIDKDLPLAADAVRRDFTINALYRDVSSGAVVDPLGGLDDIRNKVISTTHPASFRDDPLRILRALRFVSTLNDFDLAYDTAAQMKEHSAAVTGLTVKGVSGTALEELSKLLMGSNPSMALRYMRNQGVMEFFLPELAPMINFQQRSRYHTKNTDDHTFDAVQAAANIHTHAPLRVRLALLFHDSGKPIMAWTGKDGLQHYYALSPKDAIALNAPVAALESHEYWGAKLATEALNRLNAPKQLRKDVVTLVERHMLPIHENIRPFKVRKWRSELGDELLCDLITHRLCDVLGKGGEVNNAAEVLQWIANEQRRAIDAKVPISVTDLAISGKELMELGLRGPDIGKAQKELLHDVLAQPKLNDNAWLRRRATA